MYALVQHDMDLITNKMEGLAEIVSTCTIKEEICKVRLLCSVALKPRIT